LIGWSYSEGDDHVLWIFVLIRAIKECMFNEKIDF